MKSKSLSQFAAELQDTLKKKRAGNEELPALNYALLHEEVASDIERAVGSRTKIQEKEKILCPKEKLLIFR